MSIDKTNLIKIVVKVKGKDEFEKLIIKPKPFYVPKFIWIWLINEYLKINGMCPIKKLEEKEE